MPSVGAYELAITASLQSFQKSMNEMKKQAEANGRLAERLTSIRPDTRSISEATRKLQQMQNEQVELKKKIELALQSGEKETLNALRSQSASLRKEISNQEKDLAIAKAQKNQKLDKLSSVSSSVQAPLAAAVGAGLYEASKMADQAEKLMNLKAATGLTTQTLQELQFVASQSGLEFEPLMKSVEKLQKNLGNGAIQQQLKGIGVSVLDSNGKFRDMNSIFSETIGALGQMPEGIERNNLATKLFGKSSAEMAPIIAMGAQGFTNLATEAHKSGAVMNDEVLVAAAKMDEKFDAMNAKLAGVKMKFGELALSIADAVMPALDMLIDIAKPIIGVLSSMPKPIAAGVIGFLGLVAVAGPVAKGIMAIRSAFDMMRNSAIIAWAAANPAAAGVALAAVGIAAAGVAIYNSTHKKENSDVDKQLAGIGVKSNLDKVRKSAEATMSMPDIQPTALPNYNMPDTSKLSTAAASIAGAPQSMKALQASGSLPGSTELVAHVRDIKEAVLRIMRVVEANRLPVVTA